MKAIVLYDSQFGNTEKIARIIADTLRGQAEVAFYRVGQVTISELAGVDLLVVGSPTQKFKPTIGVTDFLKSIPKNGLAGVRVAAFDTRLTQKNIDETPVLPFFVKIFGYAGEVIARGLEKKGGRLVVPAEGFYVLGTEDPLVEGEEERAVSWAEKLFA